MELSYINQNTLMNLDKINKLADYDCGHDDKNYDEKCIHCRAKYFVGNLERYISVYLDDFILKE